MFSSAFSSYRSLLTPSTPTAFFRFCFRCSDISVSSFTLCIRFSTRGYFADCSLIPSAFVAMLFFLPLVCFLFPLWERLFADPFAPPAFTGFFTTMSQSDFWQAFGVSPFTRLQFPLPCFRSLPDLPSIQILLCALATLSDPDGTYGTLAYRLPYCCLRPKEKYRLPLFHLRGCIASRFRIAALALHCLRLNLTSRLRLQGCVPTAC